MTSCESCGATIPKEDVKLFEFKNHYRCWECFMYFEIRMAMNENPIIWSFKNGRWYKEIGKDVWNSKTDSYEHMKLIWPVLNDARREILKMKITSRHKHSINTYEEEGVC